MQDSKAGQSKPMLFLAIVTGLCAAVISWRSYSFVRGWIVRGVLKLYQPEVLQDLTVDALFDIGFGVDIAILLVVLMLMCWIYLRNRDTFNIALHDAIPKPVVVWYALWVLLGLFFQAFYMVII